MTLVRSNMKQQSICRRNRILEMQVSNFLVTLDVLKHLRIVRKIRTIFELGFWQRVTNIIFQMRYTINFIWRHPSPKEMQISILHFFWLWMYTGLPFCAGWACSKQFNLVHHPYTTWCMLFATCKVVWLQHQKLHHVSYVISL